jgi:hypothetical protein
LERLSWVATEHFSFQDLRFAVRSTNPTFLEFLRRYLGPIQPAEPSAEELVFSADCGVDRTLPAGRVIHGKRNLYFGTILIYPGRMYEQMTGRLLGFLRDVGTRPANEFVRLRATGGVVKGRAVLLPSPPDIRLPTLAAHLIRGGADFLGDEMVNLDPILHKVHGLGFPLLMDGEEAASIPGLNRERPSGRRFTNNLFRSAWGRYPVNVEELGGRRGEPSSLGWIVFPYFEKGAKTRLEPLGGSEALFRLTESMLNLHVWGDRGLVYARDLLESVPISRLVIGSSDEAAELVLEAAPSMLEEVSA